jgi:hypothetical protein
MAHSCFSALAGEAFALTFSCLENSKRLPGFPAAWNSFVISDT